MYGIIDFYKACKEHGIKPIIGCEVYVATGSRTEKNNIDVKYNHLIILAKNMVGYRNLCKLVSIGYSEGYYYKPRIDKEILEKYSEGLIVLSACLAGEVPRHLLNGNYEAAKKAALWYKSVFKDDYYLEIQNNGIREQFAVNQELIKLARELEIEIVATNDAHYSKKGDAYNHEILMCIQTGKKITDPDRMNYGTEELYIKSPEEMIEFFKNIPEAIENTVKIAEKCNVEFEFGKTILPKYYAPSEFKSNYDYIKKLTYDGLKKRYGEKLDDNIINRAEYELDIINKMGFVDYFLIVWDYIYFAKQNNISVGPGRGSGAGSVVAYVLEITDVEPLKYGLLFERFLNPERISMPDFDIDFDIEKRQEVIDYVSRKYGEDHVSQIITFGTMSARMVIRDVARVLDYPYAEANSLSKMIPNDLHMTINKALEINPELKNLYENDENVKNILDIAMAFEGMPRQVSTHACGVIISDKPVVDYVPLFSRDGLISTQYVMTTLEELGLLKMDFLGLRTLTVIRDCINLVKENRGITVEFDKNMDDPNVYKKWQDGDSVGIFQFESPGMTNFMKELKPDCLEDIIAGVSLYRPGPMDQIPRYIKNKKDMSHAKYTHDRLKPILEVTYGCMVYQEQVMQIVRDLAGYSLGRADLMRRAMGKKKIDVMKKEREIFIHGKLDEDGNIEIPGCVRNGIDEKSANLIFDEMSEFAKYAFNKSHAACYAVIAYQTAYLKTYYPAEFMAAMLNSYLGNLDKVSLYIEECKKNNIEILKPDINKSFTKFTVENNNIRFGLGSIKNVGINAVEQIIQERNSNGDFKSFMDFAKRIYKEQVNKKCIESLVQVGAFDGLGQNRRTLFESCENILSMISRENSLSYKGQFSMFDMDSGNEKINNDYNYHYAKEYDEKELLSIEKEYLGIYISGHPIEKYMDEIKKKATLTIFEINEAIEKMNNNEEINLNDGDYVKIAGIITSVNKKFTKNNKLMAFVTIEDIFGNVEIVVFDSIYSKYVELLVEENIIFLHGKISIKSEQQITIIANKIEKIEDIIDKKETKIIVSLDNLDDDKKESLRKLIRENRVEKSKTSIFVKKDNETEEMFCGFLIDNKDIIQNIRTNISEDIQVV